MRFYHLTEALNKVAYLVDDNQNIVRTYIYSAFGVVGDIGSYTNLYTYTGREYDHDSGLYYYRSRHYLPELARFDRVDDKRNGLNWYAYVNNNPVNYLDPYGYEGENDAATWTGTADYAQDLYNKGLISQQDYNNMMEGAGQYKDWSEDGTYKWVSSDTWKTKNDMSAGEQALYKEIMGADTAKIIADALKNSGLSASQKEKVLALCIDTKRKEMYGDMKSDGSSANSASRLLESFNETAGRYRTDVDRILQGITLANQGSSEKINFSYTTQYLSSSERILQDIVVGMMGGLNNFKVTDFTYSGQKMNISNKQLKELMGMVVGEIGDEKSIGEGKDLASVALNRLYDEITGKNNTWGGKTMTGVLYSGQFTAVNPGNDIFKSFMKGMYKGGSYYVNAEYTSIMSVLSVLGSGSDTTGGARFFGNYEDFTERSGIFQQARTGQTTWRLSGKSFIIGGSGTRTPWANAPYDIW